MKSKKLNLYNAVNENSNGLSYFGICETFNAEAYNIAEVKKVIEKMGYDSNNWSIEKIN